MKRFAYTLTLAVTVLLCATMWAQSYNFEIVKYPANNPADQFTQLLGINDALQIAGYHNVNQNSGFILQLPNSFTTENYPNSMMTQVIGINNTGTTDGFYVDNNNVTHGFTDIHGKFATVDYPERPSTSFWDRTTSASPPATTA